MSDLRALSSSLAKKSIEELNEKPNRLPEDIENTRLWTNQQKNFKSRTSDQFLTSFLRGCKHSLERSKEKLEKFYMMKENLPELYNNRRSDDPVVLDILKQGIVLPLLKPNGEDGPVVHIIRAGAYDPNKIKFTDVIKVGTIIGDIYLKENDNAVIGGLVEILDLSNVSAQHLFHIDVSFVKKFSISYENGMPIRQKEFHFLNTPPGFEGLYNIFKPLISSKNRNRVHIHGSKNELLHEHISKDILPKEYGGTCGTIKDINDYWVTKFLEYKDYFIEEDNYVMLKKLKNNLKFDDSVGTTRISDLRINGSFRKIEFD